MNSKFSSNVVFINVLSDRLHLAPCNLFVYSVYSKNFSLLLSPTEGAMCSTFLSLLSQLVRVENLSRFQKQLKIKNTKLCFITTSAKLQFPNFWHDHLRLRLLPVQRFIAIFMIFETNWHYVQPESTKFNRALLLTVTCAGLMLFLATGVPISALKINPEVGFQ